MLVVLAPLVDFAELLLVEVKHPKLPDEPNVQNSIFRCPTQVVMLVWVPQCCCSLHPSSALTHLRPSYGGFRNRVRISHRNLHNGDRF